MEILAERLFQIKDQNSGTFLQLLQRKMTNDDSFCRFQNDGACKHNLQENIFSFWIFFDEKRSLVQAPSKTLTNQGGSPYGTSPS